MNFDFNTVCGIAYSALFVAVLVLTALHGKKEGLIAGLFGFAGALGGIVAANQISGTAAQWIYENFFAKSIAEQVQNALDKNTGDVNELLEQFTFLPQSVLSRLQAVLQSGAENMPDQVVATLQPLLLPVVKALCFVVVWLVISMLVRMLYRLFRGINLVPVLGTMNQILGFCFGVVTGLLYCWILCMGLWAASKLFGDDLPFLTLSALGNSGIYNFFANLNPFIT